MPHLSFEFSRGLDACVDMGEPAQCKHATLQIKGYRSFGRHCVHRAEMPVDAIFCGANGRLPDDLPVLPSLEVQEIVTRFRRSSWGPLHAAIGKRTHR